MRLCPIMAGSNLSAEDIVDLLESITTEEDKLDASAIKNLPEGRR